jgi:outer membrane lipoprotein LolB
MISMALVNAAIRWIRIGISLFAIFLIAGCASPTWTSATYPTDSARWQGRIAVKVASAPPQSVAAQFELLGNATAGRMDLSTPLGTTIAQMRWSAQSAEVLVNGQIHRYASLADLTAATLGAELPAEALFQWLQGLPASAPGWQVNLSDWEQGRISAQRSAPSPMVDLKIILER